jgi:hypothetical protein
VCWSRKQSEFLCPVKYRNRLPDPPCEPKLIVFPFDRDALVKYRATALDEKYRWEVYLEPEAPLVGVDFIDPDVLGPRSSGTGASTVC